MSADGAYRRLLRAYPRTWRAEHGEAFLGVVLDVADADGRTEPTARERFSTYRHAATVWRAELGRRGAGDPALASLRWVGPIGLAVGSAVAVLQVALAEVPSLLAGPGFAPSWMLGVAPLWLLALGAALAGRHRTTRAALALVTAAPAVLAVAALARIGGASDLLPFTGPLVAALPDAGWVHAVTAAQPPLTVALTSLLCSAAALVAGPPRTARGRRRTALGSAAGVAAALLVALVRGLTRQSLDPTAWPWPTDGLERLDVLVVLLTLLATGAGLALLPRRPGVLLAVALLGWPWTAVAIVVHAGPRFGGAYLYPWSVEALALLATSVAGCAGLAAIAAAHRLRRAGSVAA